jgi:uncharacterized membrane protein
MGGAAAGIVYGLCSAFAWGAGDFIGGYASRRLNPLTVILVSQLAGLAMLVAAALITSEPFPAGRDLAFGAVAGLAGVVGLVALYTGLAKFKMGAIAPLSALLTAFLPIVAGLLVEGLPAPSQIAGIVVAAPAIFWVSQEAGGSVCGWLSWPVLKYPVIAGLGFGLFFILLDRVSTGAVFWPIVAVRAASITAVVLHRVLVRRDGRRGEGRIRGILPIILLGGLFDAAGNVFFALATQAGRLDIASVLASLFPAGTVILAWLVLKERLSGTQWLGVAAAITAVVLFSI